MLCSPFGDAGYAGTPMGPAEARSPERLEEECPQAEAERAVLEAFARVLATAAREAHRVTEWEGLILAELHAAPDRRGRTTDAKGAKDPR